MEGVVADREEEIEDPPASRDGNPAALRQHGLDGGPPREASGVPPPRLLALLQPLGFGRQDKAGAAPQVRIGFVAQAPEDRQ
jgi:hypothetical protein